MKTCKSDDMWFVVMLHVTGGVHVQHTCEQFTMKTHISKLATVECIMGRPIHSVTLLRWMFVCADIGG